MTPPRPPFQPVDCTLREGEQTPGVWLEPDEKLEILRSLAAAGVHLADAAMPAVAREERTFLERAVAESPDGIEVAASVRARRCWSFASRQQIACSQSV